MLENILPLISVSALFSEIPLYEVLLDLEPNTQYRNNQWSSNRALAGQV